MKWPAVASLVSFFRRKARRRRRVEKMPSWHFFSAIFRTISLDLVKTKQYYLFLSTQCTKSQKKEGTSMKETIPGQTWAASNTNWWRGFSTAQSIYYEEERIVSFFSAWFLKEPKVSGTSSWPVPWLLLRYSLEIRVIFHFDYSISPKRE